MKKLNIIIIIVSDTRTTATDKSGKALKRLISDAGHNVLKKIIIPDDIYKIRHSVSKYLVDEIVDVIITSGGTGITGRDGTPEAVSILLDKNFNNWYKDEKWVYDYSTYPNFAIFIKERCIKADSNKCKLLIDQYINKSCYNKKTHKKIRSKNIKWNN